jgi:hypothetical protein
MDNQAERLPALITRAARALANATTAAEVLDAKDAATEVYHAAKRQAKLLGKKNAHDEVIAACQRAMADAIIIEAQAQIRLADEYDAAQARGEAFATGDNQHVGKGNTQKSTSAELGIDRGHLREARKIRDAEKMKPGIIRDTLEAALKAGKDPTHAGVDRVVNEIAPRSRTSAQRKPRPKQTDNKTETIIALRDQGMSSTDIAREVGVEARAARHVIEREQAKREAVAQIDPTTLSLSAQEKLGAAIRQHKRELDLEFEQRVQQEIRKRLNEMVLPSLNKKSADAERIIKSRKGVMTRNEYKKILGCLHPDRVQDSDLKKRYEDAFNLFTKLELVLLDETQSPTYADKMPTNYADLMARKQTVAESRRKNGASPV